MSAEGSGDRPSVLPEWLAVIAAGTGVAAMMVAAAVAAPLGIRPALVLAECGLAAPTLLALALLRIPWRRGLALVPLSVGGSLLALLSGGALWAAALGLFELQYAVWPPPAGYLEQFQALHRALRPAGMLDGLVSVTAIAVAPAVGEEIVFRGGLLPSFARSLRPWAAIVLSALLFGAIHLDPTTGGAYTLYRVPFAATVGIGLGVLRLVSRSLVPCILAHAALNAITFFTVLLTAPSAEAEVANVVQAAGFFLVGGAATVWLLRVHARAAAAQGTSC